MRLISAKHSLGTLFANHNDKIEKIISENYAVCQMKVERLMRRIKNTLYISLIVLGLTLNPAKSLLTKFKLGPKDAFALTTSIPAEDQSTINKIKNEQTERGSMVSVHVNKKENGHTTVKMLEIPEYQLSDVIVQWSTLGHEINEYTIHDEAFIKYVINNTDIRSFSYMAKFPKLYFLVKNKVAEPVLYGGEIKKFFKTISFPGWLKVAGAIDEQGNYEKGYEGLSTQKEALISLFETVLSRALEGSYTIVDLYTDENGDRKGRLRFFESSEQKDPTFAQPIDVKLAFALIYLNLVRENPEDIGAKQELTKPIVKELIVSAELKDKVALLQRNLFFSFNN